jgi:hypothetical protein
MALSALGAKEISSISLATAASSNAKEERLSAEHFEPAVTDVLVDFDWQFARAYNSTALTADSSPSITNAEYDYAYTLPSLFLTLRHINSSDGEGDENNDYHYNERFLYSDATDIFIRYTYLNSDYATWPAHVIRVLWHLLAWRLAKPITGKEVVMKERERLYHMEFARAKLKDVKWHRRDPRQQADYYWDRGFSKSDQVRIR